MSHDPSEISMVICGSKEKILLLSMLLGVVLDILVETTSIQDSMMIGMFKIIALLFIFL